MNMAELTVWSLMTGGLLSLVLMSVADALLTASPGSLRNVLFAVVFSLQCVALSGVPAAWWPGLPPHPLQVLQIGISPLSSALGLYFLDIWLGGARQDRLAHALSVWGTPALLLAALALTLAALRLPPAHGQALLLSSAAVNAAPLLVGIVVTARAHRLGDPLAHWMVLACVLLAAVTAGLFLRALDVAGFELPTWACTALGAVVFLLLSMTLVALRDRMNRQLARLARLETGAEPATGLPAGGRLLAEVEHAFWRAGRLHAQCVVVGVYLGNLYELAEAMGRTIDSQILAATAARIRRAAGFRCVVGVYQPRCFIIVFTGDRRRVFDKAVYDRVHALVTRPLRLVGERDRRESFVPQVGMAMLAVHPDRAVALDVLNEVERLAMAELPPPPPSPPPGDYETQW